MKIAESQIAMASQHREASFTYREQATIEAPATKDVGGVILSLSKEAGGTSYTKTMAQYEKMQKQHEENLRKQNEARSLEMLAERMNADKEGQWKVPEEVENKIKMLRQILAALRGEKYVDDEPKKDCGSGKVLDLRTSVSTGLYFSVSQNAVEMLSAGTTGSGTLWQKVTATSGFVSEAETTSFASVGMVKTADGRSIDFNIEISMSRSFMAEFNKLEAKEYIKTDPLVINLDNDIASVTDQKFFFDLDSDGEEEQISFVGKGSGFIALDKNGDGKVNDGSELFGTKSGDGFKDLAIYDEDGNGWIDENDSVFSRLKIWSKDSEGNDYLFSLKQADVGAIYLGNTDTQFSLKSESNVLNAEIKKTGIFLRESTGAAGTMNHIDIAI